MIRHSCYPGDIYTDCGKNIRRIKQYSIGINSKSFKELINLVTCKECRAIVKETYAETSSRK